jgi:hypothetical protein
MERTVRLSASPRVGLATVLPLTSAGVSLGGLAIFATCVTSRLQCVVCMHLVSPSTVQWTAGHGLIVFAMMDTQAILWAAVNRPVHWAVCSVCVSHLATVRVMRVGMARHARTVFQSPIRAH